MLSWKSLTIPNVTFLFQLGDESQLMSAVSAQGRACGRCGCFVCSVLALQLTWSPPALTPHHRTKALSDLPWVTTNSQ